MTDQDPKPANHVPDEGLFTVSFSLLKPFDLTLTAQVIAATPTNITTSLCTLLKMSPAGVSISLPTSREPGSVVHANHKIGQFTITPPTPKDDLEEPT
jgi:hypothetical protein